MFLPSSDLEKEMKSVKNVTFCGQVTLPAIGQGTWYMGERADQRQREVSALRAGLDLGLRLIDTAEMYRTLP